MNYYIKSNFGKLKEVNGEYLEQGYNAFTSFSLLDNYSLKDDDKIIFLDSKTVIEDLDDYLLDLYSSKDVDYYTENESYKSTGSLELTNSDIQEANNFKDVTIINSWAEDICGGEFLDVDKENANGTGKWTDEIKSIGKAKISMFVSLLRQVILLIPFTIVLPLFMGLDGVWAAGACADLLSVIITIVLLVFEFKSLKKLQALKEAA